MLFLLAISLLVVEMAPLVNPVSAQSPTASISIECQELVPIEVYPGSSPIGTSTCTLSNPTVYQEKVEITVEVANLAYAAPGSVNVAGGEEVDFQVVYRAENNMLKQTITSKVTASVQEMNGVPPPNVAEDTASIMINILQFGKVSLQVDDAYVELDVGVTSNVKLKLQNNGNGNDDIRFGITDDSRNALEEAGFVLAFPLTSVNTNPLDPPSIVHMDIKAPSSLQQCVPEEGLCVAYFSLEVTATSDFSCRNSGCVYVTQSITLKILEDQIEEPEPPSQSDDLIDMGSNETAVYVGVAGVVVVLLIGLVFFRKS